MVNKPPDSHRGITTLDYASTEYISYHYRLYANL